MAVVEGRKAGNGSGGSSDPEQNEPGNPQGGASSGRRQGRAARCECKDRVRAPGAFSYSGTAKKLRPETKTGLVCLSIRAPSSGSAFPRPKAPVREGLHRFLDHINHMSCNFAAKPQHFFSGNRYSGNWRCAAHGSFPTGRAGAGGALLPDAWADCHAGFGE